MDKGKEGCPGPTRGIKNTYDNVTVWMNTKLLCRTKPESQRYYWRLLLIVSHYSYTEAPYSLTFIMNVQ